MRTETAKARARESSRLREAAKRAADPEASRAKAREYYAKNRAKVLERNNAYRRAREAAGSPLRYDEDRNSYLSRRFGITSEQYALMLLEQNGCCAVCGTDSPRSGGRYFSVDHNHETGRVRGLLCQPCNTALGLFKDDVDRLMAAVAYLLQSQDVLQLQEVTDE